jgi:hypothetical protein
MVPEARQAVEDWLAWASEGSARYQALVKVATRAHKLTVTTRLYGKRASVPDFDHSRHIIDLAVEPPPLPLPRPFLDELADQEAENE